MMGLSVVEQGLGRDGKDMKEDTGQLYCESSSMMMIDEMSARTPESWTRHLKI